MRMCEVPLLTRIVASSVSVALRAGDVIRSIVTAGADLKIVHKGVNDLQTQADRSSQQCIVTSLQKQFPKITIIGEEQLGLADAVNESHIVTEADLEVLQKASILPDELKLVDDEDICIWVDPLDATTEFVQGIFDHVTILVGIAVHGKAVAGVIAQPFYNYTAGPNVSVGRVIWAIVGLGSFGVVPKHPPPDQRVITATRSRMSPAVLRTINACEPTKILQVGGAGHKVLLLIDGKAHAYICASSACSKWDTCAPEAVLHAVGGKLTDINGTSYQYHPGVERYNRSGTLATAYAHEHDWYLERIKSAA